MSVQLRPGTVQLATVQCSMFSADSSFFKDQSGVSHGFYFGTLLFALYASFLGKLILLHVFNFFQVYMCVCIKHLFLVVILYLF